VVFTAFYLSKKRRGIVQLIRILYNLTFHNFGVTAILDSRTVFCVLVPLQATVKFIVKTIMQLYRLHIDA